MAISLSVYLYNEENARITAFADSDGDIHASLYADNGQRIGIALSPAQAKQLKKLLVSTLADSKATRKAMAQAEAETASETA